MTGSNCWARQQILKREMLMIIDINYHYIDITAKTQ